MGRTRPLDILILGSGVIGRVFAARLCQAGHRVTVLTRPGSLEVLRTQGIRLVGPRRVHTAVREVAFVDRVDPATPYDYTFVCFRGDQHADFLELSAAWNTRRMRAVICYPAWRPTLQTLADRFGELHYVFPGVRGYFCGEDVVYRLGVTRVAPLPPTKASAASRLCVVLSMAGLRGRLSPQLVEEFAVQLAVGLPFLMALSLHDYNYTATTRDRVTLELAAAAQRECLAILAGTGERLVGVTALVRHIPLPVTVALMAASGFIVRGFVRDLFEVHFRKVHSQGYAMLRDLNAWEDGRSVPAPHLQELIARCSARFEER